MPILGPSGCGKSSLARAGLIPELARRPLPARKKARVAIFTPGTHPLEALAGVLAKIATNDLAPVAKTRELTEELKITNKAQEYDGLRRIADLLPDINSSPLIVLVDQFEEVYSQCKDTNVRQAFIENLLHAAGDRAARVSVILTLRSDFLEETQKQITLSRAITNKGFIVPGMSKKELETAIAKPAVVAGHPLDEAVVKLLIEQTEGRIGALPLLQFALSRIWSGLREGISPAVTLEKIGGVGGALAGEAQNIFENLTQEEKTIAKRVFLGLVQLGEGTNITRRRVVINSLITCKVSTEQVNKVIAKFASKDVRLITLSSVHNIQTAEVTHEALFDHWDMLNEWLDNSRDKIRSQRKIETAAEEWKNQKNSVDYLLQGKRLSDAREFQQEVAQEFHLSNFAENFIKTSIKHQQIKRIRNIIIFLIVPLIGTVFLAYEGIILSRRQILQNCKNIEGNCSGRIKALEFLAANRRSLVNIDLERANLNGIDLENANLEGANLNGANLNGANLNGANLNGANLLVTNFNGANLESANFNGANLNGANLKGANLKHANFNGANLNGADLENANLKGANLKGANLSGTILWNVDLRHTKLNDSDLEKAFLCKTKIPNGNVSNKNCININSDKPSSVTTNKNIPKIKNVKTININLVEALKLAKDNNNGYLSNKIRFEVSIDYYATLKTETAVLIAQNFVIDAERSLLDAKLLEEAGLGTRSEILIAEIELINAIRELTNALIEQTIFRTRLASRLNMSSILVGTKDTLVEPNPWTLTFEESIALALKKEDKKQQENRKYIRLKVKEAFIKLQHKYDNIEISRRKIEIAEESLRLSRLRFQAGVGTISEVVNSQRNLHISRGNLLTDITDYNLNLVYLQKAVNIENLP